MPCTVMTELFLVRPHISRDKAIVFVTGEGISYSCLLRLIESIKASLKPSSRTREERI